MRVKNSPERDWATYMQKALLLAKQAAALGEVPVGALVVDETGEIIAEAFNQREKLQDPTAHAEVLAIKKASEKRSSWRLVGCTLVVTLEPCVMCAGALWQSRVDRVVYGAADPRAGAMGSIYNIHSEERLNHRINCISGVLEPECREVLQSFFRAKRS